MIVEHLLGLQIGEFLVAFVAQKQRLAAIADEYERIMGNFYFFYFISPFRTNR